MAIFVDKRKLLPSYIPERLLHRDEQMKLLLELLELRDLERIVYPKCIQVVGPTGSGKTSSCIKLSKLVEQEAHRMGFNVKSIYVNLRLEGSSRFTVYRAMVEKLAYEYSSRSLSPDEVLKQFVETLRARRLIALVVLDEVDFHVRRCKETVVYDLTRLSELTPADSPNVLGVIFVARDPSWVNLLDPAERSSLGGLRVLFPPYTRDQVLDILEYRASEALKPRAAPRDVLEYIAELSIQPPRSGDVRFALDMLLYSGVLAEQEGFDHITLDHVRAVYGRSLDAISISELEELTLSEKLVLLASAKALMASSSPYVDLGVVREYLKVVVEELGVREVRGVEQSVKKLFEKGFVEVKGRRLVGVPIGPLSKLISLLEALVRGSSS